MKLHFANRQERNNFLKKGFSSPQNLKKEKIRGDGGHRLYTRVQSKKKTAMLMSCGKEDLSLKKFINIRKRLSIFANTPKIYYKDTALGLLLLEDLGSQSLEQFFFQKGEKTSWPFYHQTLSQLIRIQSSVRLLFSDPLFDKKFFLKEVNKAIHHLQIYILKKPQPDPSLILPFKKDMEKILLKFSTKDYVYCHRDFHSRNLMLKNKKIFLIDFQDAGRGPWFYDLASLLYDSYVPLSSYSRKQLSLFYFENLPTGLKKIVGSLSRVEQMVKLQFLQRGFKACGRFAAFKNSNQKSSHLKYILPTLKLLRQSAGELSYPGIYNYIHHLIKALKTRKRG